MKTRQLRKARGRETRTGFASIMNELHPSGQNHEARRAAKAGWGRSPKAGVGWRRKQWIWGTIHHLRRLDRRCFKITGGRYLGEPAEAVNAQKPNGSRVRKFLAKLGL
jgi:hypothetical protein